MKRKSTKSHVVFPLCSIIKEGRLAQAEMEKHRSNRGETSLEIYAMGEIPSKVMHANEFAGIPDGFSISSNDLTQLIIDMDRDSEIVVSIF